MRITSTLDVVDSHLKLMAEIDEEENEEISAIKLRYAFLDTIPKSMKAIRKHVEAQMENDLQATGRRHSVARDRARERMVGSWHLIRAACDVSRVTGVNVGAMVAPSRKRSGRSGTTAMVANSRAVAIWLARQTSQCSYPILAHTMGMDHSTLLHHFKKVDSHVTAKSGFSWDLLSDIFHERARCRYEELSQEPKQE